MPLSAGTHLGPYEILAPIGAGGMGEVYRAADTRLHRTVAVKICRDPFTERFEREARAVAALNHPNICQIYDVGPGYLVMEYVDGQPLKGPLPLGQVLVYAGKICDALDAAHRRNITHRDLKPGNILVSKGSLKLLDFGLAKVAPLAAAAENTMTTALTGKGQILGTLQYMSPEQLQGRDADARSDIFAFGLVLYEMLTGRRAFDGESPASIIAAILEREPPAIEPAIPAAVDSVLRRCLAKDPDDRWQSVRDLKAALQLALESAAAGYVDPGKWGVWRARAGWMAAAVFLGLAVLAALWRDRPSGNQEVVRFAVYAPEGTVFSDSRNTTVSIPQFAVSPNGRMLVFAATGAEGRQMLWLRPMESVAARPLAGTEDGTRPFWSPDGRWIGFFADGAVKKIPAEGGFAQAITGDVSDPRGGSWGAGETILFGNGNAALLRVPANGGPVTKATNLDASHGEGAHRWPQFLPDGVHFLFAVRSSTAEGRGIYAGSLADRPKKLLAGTDSSAYYAPPGYLLWIDGVTLLAQAFDVNRSELSGQPFAVAEKAGRSTTSEGAISVSASGSTLAYAAAFLRRGRLVWFDRTGRALDSVGPEGDYPDFRLSGDDHVLAASLVDPKTSNPTIWLTDLTRGSTSRFTLGPSFNAAPAWAPDGSRLIFRTTRNGVIEFYQKSASLGGGEEAVLTAEEQRAAGSLSVSGMITDWSSDGSLIYTTPDMGGSQLWLLQHPLASRGSAKPVRFLSSTAELIHANFSPDGRYIAYGSNETGSYQVYVQTVPISNRKWLVSTNGGYEPRWRSDGREIYYLSEDRKLMAVEVGPGPSYSLPKILFQTTVSPGVTAFRTHYVPARDGRRFLINTQSGEIAANPITVVLNWAGLRR